MIDSSYYCYYVWINLIDTNMVINVKILFLLIKDSFWRPCVSGFRKRYLIGIKIDFLTDRNFHFVKLKFRWLSSKEWISISRCFHSYLPLRRAWVRSSVATLEGNYLCSPEQLSSVLCNWFQNNIGLHPIPETLDFASQKYNTKS